MQPDVPNDGDSLPALHTLASAVTRALHVYPQQAEHIAGILREATAAVVDIFTTETKPFEEWEDACVRAAHTHRSISVLRKVRPRILLACNDAELLMIRGIGKKTLRDLRQLFHRQGYQCSHHPPGGIGLLPLSALKVPNYSYTDCPKALRSIPLWMLHRRNAQEIEEHYDIDQKQMPYVCAAVCSIRRACRHL